MGLEDILDWITEQGGNIVDGVSSSFENMGEFSIMGLVFGLLSIGIIYGLSDYLLMPFLKYYSPFEKILWGGITYVGCYIAGYMLGKFFENS